MHQTYRLVHRICILNKTPAQIMTDKSVGGTVTAPVGFEDKTFAELCQTTCNSCCKDNNGDSFFTGEAIDNYYPAKTCANLKELDTTGSYAGFGWGDPCTKTIAQILTDKSAGGPALAPVGFEDKTFADLCPKTCDKCQ